jgi:hypothetical protein
MSNTDRTSYYTTDYTYSDDDTPKNLISENQMMPLLVLVALGLGIGTIIALMANQRRKPKTLVEQIEHRLHNVEKELNRFGKSLEQRIKDMQR